MVPRWSVLVACVCALGFGCRIDRDRTGGGDTFHPVGFAEEESPEFHGTYLVAHAYPLGECRECHGDDYAGGSVGVSCNGANCHKQSPEACDTCHDAKPTDGAHTPHADFGCATCHELPKNARSPMHPNGSVTFHFSGLAVANDHHPAFDRDAKTCADVYCHGGNSIDWNTEGPLGCDACHDDPPPGHARFANAQSDCARCHGGESVHVNGKFNLDEMTCSSCHGSGPTGAPPPGLNLDPESPGVGAHARHLDPTLPDRMGRVARCDDCHVIPKTMDDPGHIDTTAPSDVTLKVGSVYDPANQTCVVACHWDRTDPSPMWGDDSGAARECDACHGFPPVTTREGAAHPPVVGGLDQCVLCHRFDATTHVNGTVDFQ
ncbi:MAG: CxxxxCH/CxxCH domain-containing protein [Polyangiaceae bacterium]